MALNNSENDMNRTRTLSNNSLNELKEANFESYVLKSLKNFDETVSLSDIYDTISLYENESNDETKSSKKITWEEWYLKKKIESLNNEKKLHDKMTQKMSSNRKYGKLSEEQKQEKLIEWLKKKQQQKKALEQQLKKLEEEKKTKKEAEKEKADKKYQEWLIELKRKELTEKQKKIEEEKNIKLKLEEEKQRKLEIQQRLKENKKDQAKIRPLNKRNGVAIVNGKLKSFYDWSTSPEPGFINKVEWKN